MRPSSYLTLPERFYARLNPSPVSAPSLIAFNSELAVQLGFDGHPDATTLAGWFSGNARLPGAEPLAQAYAGHQFGHFTPQLGDGRALLLGEATHEDGRPRDVQLKGSGRTPFSRGGDGRAALGPVLREYLVSEAMHAFGVPTTRALAAVATGDAVLRERPLPGAVVTRVAASHIRVGTFEYFAARGDNQAVALLADYVIERHYPALSEHPRPYLALLQAVVERQAALVAAWMQLGFIHGVMNTDNMAVSGETIDFGPCAFMDAYDAEAVFSSIDHGGRYAYGNQPRAAAWNLARLAEALLPVIDADAERAVRDAGETVEGFAESFSGQLLQGWRRKLGLTLAELEDAQLVRDLLQVMQDAGADFTQTLRALCEPQMTPIEQLGPWLARWQQRLLREPVGAGARTDSMRRANPVVIPRNHRIEEVIQAAVEQGDFAPFERLRKVLSTPYAAQPGFESYCLAPRPEQRVLQTFCGT